VDRDEGTKMRELMSKKEPPNTL